MKKKIDTLSIEMNTREKCFEWWNDKTSQEQKMIEQKYAQLSEVNRQSIEQINYPLTTYSGSHGIFTPIVDPFPLYYMCNHAAHFNYLSLDASTQAALAMPKTASHEKTIDKIKHVLHPH